MPQNTANLFLQQENLNINVFDLTSKKYEEVTEVLNILIEHLNGSVRHITSKIRKFKKIKFPSELQMKIEGKEETDYMDEEFVQHWKYYVLEGQTDKMEDGQNRSKEQYIEEYNKSVSKMN